MFLKSAEIFALKSGGINPVLLRLTTDSGVVGLGEAAVAYGVGAKAAAAMLQELAERFLRGGVDPYRTESIAASIKDFSFWAKGGGPILHAGLSAIEQALIDIKARSLDVPVYELLGGRMRDTLRTYANGWYFGCSSDRELPAAAERTVADGYSSLKFYPFAEILDDGRLRHPSLRGSDDPDLVKRGVALVAAVREAVGPDVELLLDLSAGLTPFDAIRFCHEIEKYDVAFVEEPTEPDDLNALKLISERVSQPIAVGERLYGRQGFRDLLESRSVAILQPDLGNTGGIWEARKIAAMAEAYGLKVQPHICASSLSTAIGAHFSASIPNFYVQEHFPYWARVPGYVEVLQDPLEPRVQNGCLPVDDRPGFGVDLDDERIADFLFCRIDLT
ncbi:mandelate racemase/muconate lactonizing enzyme family protein [Afifella sp. JA880]|uniref:mandelate racemase/muconate lactonizing enzyme family protein n=1 Tax=Afifella sp. JA880 TaxID=2975280 RepID=UPI0021BA4D93|nr:mandelate racemase/muconate lactonizing enzyme family protein [Afifella sp. JA880]MCT8267129.1 mandelate racemase/muconate lactonizing enzyme family protein [Afifella sp. JA880]